MQAVVTPTTSLTLLVPSPLLPAEGDGETWEILEKPVTSTADLFSFYEALTTPLASRFILQGEDIAFDGDLESESTLQMLHFSTGGDNGITAIETRPAMSHFDWAGVLDEVSAAVQSPHFLGTPEELARVFTEAVREVSSVAALGFSGEAIPLLSVSVDAAEGAATVSFLGIWLADEKGIQDLRQTLPAQSWLDGADVGQTTCILLDAAEVEGRGLKEAAMSAMLLAMVFGSSMGHAAEPAAPKAQPVSLLGSLFNKDDKKGEKLQVKTQKLVQESPRIYRDVLNTPDACETKVVVDIGAQRAYLLKDGRIAFETPISTGRGKRMTPRGTFTITEKVRSGKMSTIYKCPLPGWMRLGQTAIGMHEGQLPGHPASHGCIRMPLESALFIFDNAPKSTTVQVTDSWSPPTAVDASLVAAVN